MSPLTRRLRQCILRPALLVQDLLPEAFFTRGMQVAIDAALTATSLYLAYQLRFDSVVPVDTQPTMYFWMVALPILRPALMWANGIYRLTWRYFGFSDALQFAAGASLSSVALLALRFCFTHFLVLANPLSVTIIEYVTFLLLASAARAARRMLATETLFATGTGKRLLLIGSEKALVPALHQISSHGALDIVGLLLPSCNGLKGMRINGFPVLGDAAGLPELLRQGLADLVMITDAKLKCIGDVVSLATHHGVEVRLLPSAVDVMRGDLSISAPPRSSQHIERILVLGGAGYIGSTLVRLLLDRGYKVRVLDRLLFGDEPLKALSSEPNFQLMIGDVRDVEAVVAAVRDCDAVIDLAALVGDPACAINKQLSIEINRAATRMLVEICKGYGVTRLVFASTCSVYGAADYLVDELTPPAPISTYAETKVGSEQILLQAASKLFQPVILRLGTLFGLSPRPRFDLVVNLLTARAASSGKITVFNSEQWRPFLHVYDAARAFLLAVEISPELASGEIYNVGDYHLNLRLGEVSRRIADLVPSVEVEHVDNADKRNYRASFDKIHTKLGFRCERTIEAGIREILEAICSGQIDDYTSPHFNNQLATQLFAESASAEQSSMRRWAKLAA